jgi:hypothetical protein
MVREWGAQSKTGLEGALAVNTAKNGLKTVKNGHFVTASLEPEGPSTLWTCLILVQTMHKT